MGVKHQTLSRKKQIEQEAALLFMQRGYASTSMRDLAQAVGLEAGSIYSHFKSKEHILQKICFDMANRFFAELDSIETANTNSQEKLELAIKAHIDVLTEDPAETSVFQNEWKHLKDPYLGDFIKMRKDYELRFKQIIQDGIQNQEFRAQNVTLFVATLLTSLNHTTQWYKKGAGYSSAQIAKDLTEIFIKGLLN